MYDVSMMRQIHSDTISWHLSGISDEAFGLGRPLAFRQYPIPHNIELDGLLLRWSNSSNATPRRTEAGARLLEQFVALADAPPERILRFARRWGVLELCKHGLPACHDGRCTLLSDGGNFYEHIVWWQKLAAVARALLNIAARLADAQPGRAVDWGAVKTLGALGKSKHFEREGLAVDRVKLEVVLNVLLSIAKVGPCVRWSKGGWLIELSGSPVIGSGLAAAIITQLALACTGGGGWVLCSNCQASYVPKKRRPDSKRRHYCPECRRRKVPERDAARDYRKRKNAAGQD